MSEQPEQSTGPDLSFATTEELLAELRLRHRAMAFVAVADDRERGLDKHTYRWWGGLAVCLGLVTAMKARIEHHMCETTESEELPGLQDEDEDEDGRSG